MREFLGICLGVLVIGGIGATSIGVVDSRSGAGLEGTATGTICMAGNELYYDTDCADTYISGPTGFLQFYANGTEGFRVQSSSNISLVQHTFNIGMSLGDLRGQIRGIADSGAQLCTYSTDGFQNNNWLMTNIASCGTNHGLTTPSTNPTLWVYSGTTVSVDNTQWLSLTHDTAKAVLDTGTGPVYVDRAAGGNDITITSDDTLDYAYNVVYLDGASNDITATLPSASGCPGQFHRIKRVDGSTFSVDIASTDNIDGSASKALSQYDSYLIHCDPSASTYWIH